MMLIGIIVAAIILSCIVINNDDTFVLIKDKFNGKIKYTKDPVSFKMPYPIQRIIARVPVNKTITRYLEVGNTGMDFTLSFTVTNPVIAYEFIDNFDDYIFEFIYNVFDLDKPIDESGKLVYEKLSKVMLGKGVELKEFQFK